MADFMDTYRKTDFGFIAFCKKNLKIEIKSSLFCLNKIQGFQISISRYFSYGTLIISYYRKYFLFTNSSKSKMCYYLKTHKMDLLRFATKLFILSC